MADPIVSRPPSGLLPAIKDIRVTLFQAHGIVTCVRYALDSKLEGLPTDSVDAALSIAARLIDDAASKLEGAQ